jgi:hypothetical protein
MPNPAQFERFRSADVPPRVAALGLLECREPPSRVVGVADGVWVVLTTCARVFNIHFREHFSCKWAAR